MKSYPQPQIHIVFKSFDLNTIRIICRWRDGATSIALALRSIGHKFKSYSGQPWASCSHLCASVTKQYNLVPAKGRWCSVAGKVTTGLAESNGSLPPGGWLTVTCGLRADCLYTGISSGPNARYRVWEAFTFYLYELYIICILFGTTITLVPPGMTHLTDVSIRLINCTVTCCKYLNSKQTWGPDKVK